MSDILELTKKWKETGLLDQLENKAEVARSLEEAYQYVVETARKEEDAETEWAAGIILPAISRIYRQNQENLEVVEVDEISEIDGEKFAKTFMEMSEEHGYKELAEDMDTYHAVEAEVEICQVFVGYYLQNHVE